MSKTVVRVTLSIDSDDLIIVRDFHRLLMGNRALTLLEKLQSDLNQLAFQYGTSAVAVIENVTNA